MNDPMNETAVPQGEQFEYDFEQPPGFQTVRNAVNLMRKPPPRAGAAVRGRVSAAKRRRFPTATHSLALARHQGDLDAQRAVEDYQRQADANRCSCGAQKEFGGVQPGGSGGRWIRVGNRIILLGI